MGTNYYLKKSPCQHCGRSESEIHIGKSSGGWCFSLHVYPENGINDLADWIPILENADNAIRDEYGELVPANEMLSVIRERGTDEPVERKPHGYANWTEFHEMNHSKPGPRGLLRCRLDDGRCIKNGDGTWDCVVGEFS